jgi:hypothetical protein
MYKIMLERGPNQRPYVLATTENRERAVDFFTGVVLAVGRGGMAPGSWVRVVSS